MTMADTSRTKTDRGSADSSGAALRDAGQELLGMLVQRATRAATDRVGGLTDRLTTVSENGGRGLTSALRGGDDRNRDDDEDGDKPKGLLRRGIENVKEKLSGAFGGGGGGQGKKLKVTNIVEQLDIGLPLRTVYNLWSQYEDFPSFMKKVESVERGDSDEKSNWKAQVLWSHRTWEATIVEQVPDSHIVWNSSGQKGHVDGAVTFTELGPNMTRVLLVLEYWPQGFFERTGNIWRAQGRRARLEFKHFRRHAMTSTLLHQEEVEGWRGEIRDGEVVKTHEEAIAEEGGEARRYTDEPRDEDDAYDEYDEDDVDDESADADDGYDDSAQPDDEPYDEYDESAEADDEAYDEDDEYDDSAEADDEPYDEYEEDDESTDTDDVDAADNGSGRRRAPARSSRKR
jgi:hypothetical protein